MLKNGHQTDGGFNETKLMLFNAKAIFSICEMFQINAKRVRTRKYFLTFPFV
jgi:hypothetical protein